MKGDVMADDSKSSRELDQAVENALKVYEDGYRIIAGWFNAVFKTTVFRTQGVKVEIDVEIEADPPTPGVTLDDCRRRLSNSLVAIRPLCEELEPDGRLCPWVVGYLATETDQPGKKPVGIALAKDPNLAWASFDTAEAIENIVQIKRSRWKDAGKWRAYVVEPMERHAESWRERLWRLHSGSATPAVDKPEAKQKAAEKPGSKGAPREEIGEPVEPKHYLLTWRAILEALNQIHTDESKERVRKLNEKYSGPIIMGGRGEQPKVTREKLLEWWNGLESRFRELEARDRDRQATVESQYKHGRDATAVPEIGGHVKKRRRK